ncbi:MAG TPA: DUF6600 domain-containing protein [Planctomycetota bacterium]|jgi:hypothetical protein
MFSMLRHLSWSLFLAFGLSALCAGASEGFLDLARLTESGANSDDMIAYIRKTPTRFDLTARERSALFDLGAEQAVCDAIEEHDRALGGAGDAVAAADDLQWDAEAALPEAETVNEDVFYHSLSPYGTWFEDDGQWVWRPTVSIVDPHWRPYCHHGRWAMTERGWTWSSEYSWGWAPFHYGRWHRDHVHGWVWTPGLEWGPGWVAWRTGASDCGWAPMPPAVTFRAGVGVVYGGHDADWGLIASDFTFVSIGKLFEPRWWEFRLHKDERNRMYERLPMAHTHFEMVNNNYINRGLELSVVERITGRRVPHIELARPVHGDAHFRPERLEGNKLVLYQPTVRRTVTATPIVIQQAREERIKKYEIVHDERMAKARVPARTAENQRHQVLAAEMQQVAERQKQREADAEARRLRSQRLTSEAELKRISVAREEADDRVKREAIQKAEQEQKRRLTETRTREAQATREAEQRRKEAENAERVRASKIIEDQRRAQDEQRRAHETELAAQKERGRQLDEQRKSAADAQRRSALDQQQAELRKEMETKRAAQAESQRQAEDNRKAQQAAVQAQLEQSHRADQQRTQRDNALESARQAAAAKASDRQREALRDNKPAPADRKGR